MTELPSLQWTEANDFQKPALTGFGKNRRPTLFVRWIPCVKVFNPVVCPFCGQLLLVGLKGEERWYVILRVRAMGA